jgi:hypothetical protein
MFFTNPSKELTMFIALNDTLISLQEAALLLPRRRGGKPTHPVTIARWAAHGLNGVKLDVLRVGSMTFTTNDALQRFCDELTQRETGAGIS